MGQSSPLPKEIVDLLPSLFQVSANQHVRLLTPRGPVPRQDDNIMHIHDDYEFTVPLSHSPVLSIDKRTFLLPRNHVFPCNPGQLHAPAQRAEGHFLMAFQINRHYLHSIAASLFRGSQVSFSNEPSAYDHQLGLLLQMFADECEAQQTGNQFVLDNLSCMIVIHLLRVLNNESPTTEPRLAHGGKRRMTTAVDFLHANWDKDFSWDDLQAVVGLSKYHFIRLFKLETGKTPYRYFIDLKLDKASILLRSTNHSITDICFMCGFKSHSHFTRLFQSKLGVPPFRYRQLQQN